MKLRVISRLVDYVLDLSPVRMQGIVSVNESRRIVGRLAKPVVELMILQEKTLVVLSKHEKNLRQVMNNINDLRKMLYTPTIKYMVGKVSICEIVNFNDYFREVSSSTKLILLI